MDWESLFSNMTEEGFKEVYSIISSEHHKREEIKSFSLPELNGYEIALIHQDKTFNSLREYRNRVNCSVYQAKIVQDRFLNSIKKLA